MSFKKFSHKRTLQFIDGNNGKSKCQLWTSDSPTLFDLQILVLAFFFRKLNAILAQISKSVFTKFLLTKELTFFH